MDELIICEIRDPQEMARLFPLIAQLNRSITLEKYESMLPNMIQGGYFMFVAYMSGMPIGLSGIWTGTKLYCGKYVEMDNVVIDQYYRSKGIGQLLVKKTIEYSTSIGADHIMLDAYLENEGAHSFYIREGFIKRGYHFIKKL